MRVRLHPTLLLLLLFLGACTPKEKDLYDPDAQNRRDEENQLNSERSHAAKCLGTQFSADQTWMMSRRHTVRLNNLPTDTDFDQFLVVTANPLTDADQARILAEEEVRMLSLSYESPDLLSTLYAVCRSSATGEAKVCSFSVSSGTADFRTATSGIIPSLAPQKYTYAFEDTRAGDYDMNDLVFRCWRDEGNKVYVQLMAVGSTNNMLLYFYDNVTRVAIPLFGGQEVHQMMELMGNGKSSYYNTSTLNAANFPLDSIYTDANFTFATAGFYVLNQAKSAQVKLPSSYDNPKGYAPYALCFPTEWQWPTEKTVLSLGYMKFSTFALLRDGGPSWYTNPSEGLVVVLDQQ